MKLHFFLSVHEILFAAMADLLVKDHGVRSVSGFAWGEDQRTLLRGSHFEAVTIFTSDVLRYLDAQPADVAYLASWEKRCGVPLHHMIYAERHLTERYGFDRTLRIAELVFRRVERDFDENLPDLYVSEDVSCLCSYIHWAVAQDRGVPRILLRNARFPGRITTYGNPLQRWERLERLFPSDGEGRLTGADWAQAEQFIADFRARPVQPTGTADRNRLRVAGAFDVAALRKLRKRWKEDRFNPTLSSPISALNQRCARLARHSLESARGGFEQPVAGEPYVLFPLQLQPEATTLVCAPYFIDLPALAADIAKSLPVGFKLYVKEHMVSRGRRDPSFYERIRSAPGVRLLSATTDPWALLRGCSAVATVTGTMGWEALLLGRPAVTFGSVYYDVFPGVVRMGEAPKPEWPRLFSKVLEDYVPDEVLLRQFVAAAWKATFPGAMGNPHSAPELMEPGNIRALVQALIESLGPGP